MLLGCVPKNRSEEAALARARQLTDFKWTPLRDVPTYSVEEGQVVLPAGVEVTGFPYSSTEATDKFITENVSFEAFLSAISNPHSKIYQHGWAAFSATNFGVVCNGFVRYAFGINRRVNTARWFALPGMRLVAQREAYKAEDIRLLDVLYAFCQGRHHVSLITDILRTEDGQVIQIEVSEAVRPSCKRACYTVEEFFEKFKLFSLCRYDKLDEVPPLDTEQDDLLWHSKLEKAVPKIAVDNGNKSNYLVGEAVLVSVNTDEADVVEMFRDGELLESHKVGKKAMFPLTPSRGYYTLKLQKAGEEVEFCVNQAEVTHSVADGRITVFADPHDPSSEIVYLDFRRAGPAGAPLVKYEELTEDEKTSGRFTRAIPDDAGNFKVYYRNRYGVWTHPVTKIDIV